MGVSSVGSASTMGNYYSANKSANATSTSASSSSTTGSTSTTTGSSSSNTGAASTTSGTTSSSSDTTSNFGNMTDFLSLFTTQLKYQDPMNPMDASNFSSQLAQFTSVEQLTNLNTNMKALSAYSNSLNNLTSTSLIGKSVIMNDGTSGTVTGVKFDSGVTYLKLDNGSSVQMINVKEINSAASTSTTSTKTTTT
ncbi:MAG: flagellar biosynthesis protein FlgD [Nitrospirae bacterium]|nr:flagellar biosynthesis protein FlgD [Nitrospirota bacterium]